MQLKNARLALILVLASCAASEPAVERSAVVIPGDWVPPASTLAISNPQYVEVIDPPRVSEGGRCDSTCPDDVWGLCTHPACVSHPGTPLVDSYIRSRWPYVRAGGTYTCRRNSNPASCEYLSVHSIGRAIDLMITQIGGDADNTAGDAVANWLIENAEYVGVQRVIWDGRYWNGSRRGNHFSDISDATVTSSGRSCGGYCTDHHTNHIHVELSVDASERRTRFFTEGPPPTTCPVVCYGTAAVREDCSFTDCAATGEVCLADPVRCGPGAPPEPAEAVLNAVPLPPATTVAGLTRFVPTTPTRLFDTRTPESSTLLVRSDGATAGPLGPTRTGTLPTIPGVPAATSTLWLNVTAVPLTTPGFLTVHAAGPVPAISTLNYTPPRVRANATAVAVSAGGVSFTALNDVDVIADMTGAFATEGLGLRTAGPLRVLDTRSTDTALVPGVPHSIDVHAPADARAVVASVAAIQGGPEAGFVTAFPCGGAVPATSNVNFVGASVTANTIISQLGTSGADLGQLCVVSSVAVHVVVDVTGYLVETGELSYQAVSPVRLLDTRQPTSLYSGRLGEGQTVELPIQTMAGLPADVRGVIVNLATVSPGTRGFVTAFPCGMPVPGSSSLNFDADGAIAAVSISATGSGSLCLFSNARTHLIVDLLGVWVPTPGATPPTTGPGPNPDDPEEMNPTEPVDGGTPSDEDAGAVSGDDAASMADGSARADAGRSETLRGACACGVSAPRDAPVWSTLALAALVFARWRRRTDRARRTPTR